jgi:dihydroorotase
VPLVLGGVRAGWAPLDVVIAALTTGPARVLGVDMPEGDKVVIDTEAEWTVTPESLLSLGKNTPLVGRSVRGRVESATLGGGAAKGGRRVAEAVRTR